MHTTSFNNMCYDVSLNLQLTKVSTLLAKHCCTMFVSFVDMIKSRKHRSQMTFFLCFLLLLRTVSLVIVLVILVLDQRQSNCSKKTQEFKQCKKSAFTLNGFYVDLQICLTICMTIHLKYYTTSI